MGPEADLDVVGFGALNLDIIYRVDSVEVAGLEPGREIFGWRGDMRQLSHILESHGGPPVSITPGGSAANTIYALRRMGFHTGYIGAIGEGEIGDRLIEGLGDPMDLGVVRRGSSGSTVIAVGPDGDRSIVVFPNANDTLTKRDVDHLLIARSRVLHLTSFVGNAPLEAQVEAVARLPQDIKVTLDPGELYAALGMDGIAPLLERADVVMPNMGELLKMTGQTTRERAADLLFDMGVDTVVCKMGAKGIVTYERKDSSFSNIGKKHKAKVMGDTVGAGDVANAGYLAGMVSGLSHIGASHLADECAYASIGGHGREAYPDKAFLVDKLKYATAIDRL